MADLCKTFLIYDSLSMTHNLWLIIHDSKVQATNDPFHIWNISSLNKDGFYAII